MPYLDTDCPKLQRAMMIEQINNSIFEARGCWTRAASAGDKQAMGLFERQGKARVEKLKSCIASFNREFGKNYRIKNSAI